MSCTKSTFKYNWQVHVHLDFFLYSSLAVHAIGHFLILAPSAAWLHIAKTLPRTDKRECCCRRSSTLCSAPWLLFTPGGTWYLRQSEDKSFQTTFLTKDPLHGCFGTRAHHTCSVTWLCGMSLALRCQLLRGELGAVLQGCEPDLLVGATFLYPATVFFVVTMKTCQYFDDIFPSVPVLAQLPLILLHQNSIPR